MPIVTLREVRKTYPLGEGTVEALRGIDFAIEPGEMVAQWRRSGPPARS